MIAAVGWFVAVLVTGWALLELAAAWRDRPRPVRDAAGSWRVVRRRP